MIPSLKSNHLEDIKIVKPPKHSYADQFHSSIVSESRQRNFIDTNKKEIKKIQILKVITKEMDRIPKF